MNTTALIFTVAIALFIAALILILMRKPGPQRTLEQRAQQQAGYGIMLVVIGFVAELAGFFFPYFATYQHTADFAILIGTLMIGFAQIRVR